jgi:hypothetical protein
MASPADRRKLTRRHRTSLAVLAAVLIIVLFGLYQRNQQPGASLPEILPPLIWKSPTPNAVVRLLPSAVASSQPVPLGTPTPNVLPGWLDGHPTPARQNEPGPTSTPTAYFSFLPILQIILPVPSPVPPLKTEPPAAQSTPQWPDGLDHQTASKIGLHTVTNNDPYIMEFVRRVRPRVMKAVDDLGWLSDVHLASPNTVTIGRIEGQNESLADTTDPTAAAQAYVQAHLAQYRLNPGIDYWEGWNEYVAVTDAHWTWYAQFEAARVCDMQAQGLHAAVGGFAAGTPEYDKMGLFLPALDAAHRCGGIFTLHEGVSPLIGCGVFQDKAGIIPGAPLFPGITLGYFMLRYRFWYEGYLKPRGLGDLPLVISELEVGGLVPGQSCNGPGGGGWKAYGDWWVQNGVGPDGPHAYVNLLAWYDSEIRKDPYVIGAEIFTAGAMNSGDSWNSTDVHDTIIPLAYYEVTQR